MTIILYQGRIAKTRASFRILLMMIILELLNFSRFQTIGMLFSYSEDASVCRSQRVLECMERIIDERK